MSTPSIPTSIPKNSGCDIPGFEKGPYALSFAGLLELADYLEEHLPDAQEDGTSIATTDEEKRQFINAYYDAVMTRSTYVIDDFVKEHGHGITLAQAKPFVVRTLRAIATFETSESSIVPSVSSPSGGDVGASNTVPALFNEHKAKIESLLVKIAHETPVPWEGGLTWRLRCVFDEVHGEASVRFGLNSETGKYFDDYKCSSCKKKDFAAFSLWAQQDHTKDEVYSKVTALVKQFNKDFFVVENYGGKCRICWIDSDESLGRFISHQSFPDFHNRYQHRLVQTGVKTVGGVVVPVKKDHADIWLNHAERRQYTKVVFKPGETTPAEIYNLWQGFAYEPKQGGCDLYLNHVRDNICRGDEGHFKWLVNWMAYAVQHPNEQGHSALVVFGKKGVGKNIMAETFSRLWGAHGMTVNDQKRVTGNFNNHLRDKCVLVCDEAFFAGDPRQDRVLKSLVTSDTITIESKGIDTVTVANLLRVIILGNDRQLVRATYDERRYFVLECGDDQRNNQEYFGSLKNQLEHDGGAGYSALLFYLLNVDLTGFNVRKPPHTDELREQMHESTDGGMDVIREILVTGLLPCNVLDNGNIHVNLNQVVGWAIKKRPEWSRIKYNALRDVLGDRGLGFKPVRQVIRDGNQGVLPMKRMRIWQLPNLKTCRRMWDERYFRIPWPDDGDEWETTCTDDVAWEG
jgi:Family of unknown function (DUF5906)